MGCNGAIAPKIRKKKNYGKMERLYLDNVKDKIKAESIDQTKDWCKNRDLKVYDEGFAAFVLDFEFELAYDFEYIVMLIEEYDGNWFDYYTNRESKTHIPPSKIAEITSTYPAIKKGQVNDNISSSLLIQSNKSVYSIKEAANELGICTKTVRNEIKAGRIIAEKTNSGTKRHYRISKKSLDEYLTNNKKLSVKQQSPPKSNGLKKTLRAA